MKIIIGIVVLLFFSNENLHAQKSRDNVEIIIRKEETKVQDVKTIENISIDSTKKSTKQTQQASRKQLVSIVNNKSDTEENKLSKRIDSLLNLLKSVGSERDKLKDSIGVLVNKNGPNTIFEAIVFSMVIIFITAIVATISCFLHASRYKNQKNKTEEQ